MAYCPNALPILWNTITSKYVDYSETSVDQYAHYDGGFYKFSKATKLYSSSSTYAVDDYCIYNDGTTSGYYKCTTAITTPEAWTAAHWTAVTKAAWFGATAAAITISSQFGAGASVDYAPVAKAFSTTSPYSAGDFVIYDGKLYKANEAIPAGAWAPSKWTQTYAVDETGNVTCVAPAYVSGQAYAVGKYVTKDNKLYRCVAAQPASAWVEADWTVVTAAESMATFNISTNDNFAPEYSTAGVYGVGSIVVHSDDATGIYKIYQGNQENITGDWDSSKWTEIKVTDELYRFKTNQVAAKITPATVYSIGDYATWQDELYKVTTAIPAYDASAGTYAVGDYVEQGGKFYCCKTAITIPEAFDSSKWDEKTNAETIAACFTKVTIMSQIGTTTDQYLIETYAGNNFDSTKDYSAYYEFITKDGKIYYPKVDIAAGSAFDPNQWEEMTNILNYSYMNMAPAFSTSETYKPGDVVMYQSCLCKALKLIPTGTAFDWNDWDMVTVANSAESRLKTVDVGTELFSEVGIGNATYLGHYANDIVFNRTDDTMAGFNKNIVEYNECFTYAVGDICICPDDGKYYKCVTAISTPHAWVASEWETANTWSKLVDANAISNHGTISDQLNACFSQNSVAPAFGIDDTHYYYNVPYSVGDLVVFRGYLWKCSTALSEYSITATYNVGDWVVAPSTASEQCYHICKQAITAGKAWDENDWKSIDTKEEPFLIMKYFTVTDIISEMPTAGDYLNETAGAQVFDVDTAYSVYDRVIHDGDYYMAITAHAAGQAWISSNWYKLNLVMEIQNNRNQLVNQFVSQEMWTAGKYYNVDDTIYIYSSTPFDTVDIYICKIAHTSGTSFDTTEKANWKRLGVYGASLSTLIKPNNIFKTVTDYTASSSNVGQLYQDKRRLDVISSNTGYLTYQSIHNMDSGSYEFGTYEGMTHPKFEIQKLMDQLGQALGITVTYTEPMISGGTYTDWQYAVSAVPNYYPEYKTATGTTYNVGDRVMHLGKYYMAKESVTSGVWDDTKWLEVNPEEERAKDAAAEITALGLTRAVTYNSTTGAFEYTYTTTP